MPTVRAPGKILVTGASGFLGVHVVKSLVEKGYFVRGTVRTPAKGEYLKRLFGDKFEYVIVEDIETPNAFDRAVIGCDAVEHTASVVEFVTGHPDLVIGPAVAGTVGVLESIKKCAPTVKRVIITSSAVAVAEPKAGKYTYTEADWNQAAVDAVKEKGIDALPGQKYGASKVLAERAAWDFMEKNEGLIGFDLVTICPPWIWGPILQDVNKPASLNASTQFLLRPLDADSEKKGAELVERAGSFIDARDVANIHVELLSKEAAGNERYIAVAGSFTWQDVYDCLNEAPGFENVPLGVPGATKGKYFEVRMSGDKLLTLLGRPGSEVFRPLAATVRDTVESVRSKKW